MSLLTSTVLWLSESPSPKREINVINWEDGFAQILWELIARIMHFKWTYLRATFPSQAVVVVGILYTTILMMTTRKFAQRLLNACGREKCGKCCFGDCPPSRLINSEGSGGYGLLGTEYWLLPGDEMKPIMAAKVKWWQQWKCKIRNCGRSAPQLTERRTSPVSRWFWTHSIDCCMRNKQDCRWREVTKATEHNHYLWTIKFRNE